MAKRGRPRQEPLGAGDFLPTDAPAAWARRWGISPQHARRILPILKLPFDQASGGWLGPDGLPVDVERVTHIDSGDAAKRTYHADRR